MIADTGFVVALLNVKDSMHKSAVDLYGQTQFPILLPQTVLVEVAYLVNRSNTIDVVANFLTQLPDSRFQLIALTSKDIQRTSEILSTYADSRIDFVDATVMAVAERVNISTILTLDRRDFQIFRPRHCEFFTLLP